MKKFDDLCYPDSFIKEVIVKIDFSSPVEVFSKKLNASITKVVLTKFPLAELQKVQSQEFQVTDTKVTTNTKEIAQWVYHSKERDKSLVISPLSIFLTVKTYQSYEKFKSDFFDVIDAILKVKPELSVNRIGIRYINVIEPKVMANPLDWSGFINKPLLGSLNFKNKQDYLSRAFNILEYKFDNTNLKYQFGIPNPDYPSVIKKKQFILDLDAYQIGAFELGEVEALVDVSHDLIQEFFELSITEDLRTLMKGKSSGKRK